MSLPPPPGSGERARRALAKIAHLVMAMLAVAAPNS